MDLLQAKSCTMNDQYYKKIKSIYSQQRLFSAVNSNLGIIFHLSYTSTYHHRANTLIPTGF